MTKTQRTLTLVTAVIAALSHQRADAGLNIDFRLTGITGAGSISSNHEAVGVFPGTVLRFDIFAVVRGNNAQLNDDKFISISGSLRSSGASSLLGNVAGDLVRSTFDSDGDITTAGFDGLGASVGLQQDLDGDGDLDVGSNNDSNAEHFWAARFALAPSGIGAGSLSPTTGGRRIGFGTFTVTGSTFFPNTFLGFDGRSASTAANYIQDGQTIQEVSIDSLVPIFIRGPVPEPSMSAIALMTAGGAAMVRRRRPQR